LDFNYYLTKTHVILGFVILDVDPVARDQKCIFLLGGLRGLRQLDPRDKPEDDDRERETKG
jgi:hypothetical protein